MDVLCLQDRARTQGGEGGSAEQPGQAPEADTLQSSLAIALERARSPSPLLSMRPGSGLDSSHGGLMGRSPTPDGGAPGSKTTQNYVARVSSGRRVSSNHSSYGMLVPRVSAAMSSTDDLRGGAVAWEDSLTVAAMRRVLNRSAQPCPAWHQLSGWRQSCCKFHSGADLKQCPDARRETNILQSEGRV